MKTINIMLITILTLVCQSTFAQTDSLSSQPAIEYIDGRPYMFFEQNGIVVGTSIMPTKDDYGKYYQLGIYIRNNTDYTLDFIPDSVSATLLNKRGEASAMKVYTKEKLEKKIKRDQAWTAALTGLAVGLNAGMAGYSTSYQSYRVGNYYYSQPVTTYNYAAASAANMAASTQLYVMGQQMKNDLKESTFGYLQRNTLHTDMSVSGFMNIKHQKGKTVIVTIPVGNEVFHFEWDVEKKRK